MRRQDMNTGIPHLREALANGFLIRCFFSVIKLLHKLPFYLVEHRDVGRLRDLQMGGGATFRHHHRQVYIENAGLTEWLYLSKMSQSAHIGVETLLRLRVHDLDGHQLARSLCGVCVHPGVRQTDSPPSL